MCVMLHTVCRMGSIILGSAVRDRPTNTPNRHVDEKPAAYVFVSHDSLSLSTVPFLQELTEKVDVYSLSMVFYSMLALKPPFEGEARAQHKIMTGIPPVTDPSWHPGFVEVSQVSMSQLAWLPIFITTIPNLACCT